MTAEEFWRQAFEAEQREPSEWTPDARRLEAVLAERLRQKGCLWPDVAARVLLARSRTSLNRADFAARLGLTEEGLRALEGS